MNSPKLRACHICGTTTAEHALYCSAGGVPSTWDKGGAAPKCPGDEHVRNPVDELYCVRCGWAVCYGCGHAFDLMCDVCDDPEHE